MLSTKIYAFPEDKVLVCCCNLMNIPLNAVGNHPDLHVCKMYV